ncbi:MAG: hypothetical protein J7507_13990 [Pseudoxanthomonas sp.]|nr:hypothetical protein [Pseudoxanthomonas sp.]
MIHDIRVDAGAVYRVYEVDKWNFEMTCQELSVWEDKGGVAVLVASHVPLTSAATKRLPTFVPWLGLDSGGITEALQVLRESLVEPLLRPGLVGVDFADYACALSRGGQIGAYSVRDQGEAKCIEDLLKVARSTRNVAASGLHIQAPAQACLNTFDRICSVLEHHFPWVVEDRCLLVVAATPWNFSDFRLSFLSLSRGSDE